MGRFGSFACRMEPRSGAAREAGLTLLRLFKATCEIAVASRIVACLSTRSRARPRIAAPLDGRSSDIGSINFPFSPSSGSATVRPVGTLTTTDGFLCTKSDEGPWVPAMTSH